MWLPKWLWTRYFRLRTEFDVNKSFTFKQAKDILKDKDAMLYKAINELNKSNILAIELSKKDKRIKQYKILLDLDQLPYHNIEIPTNVKAYIPAAHKAGILTRNSIIGDPKRLFNKLYKKDGKEIINVLAGTELKTIEDLIISSLKSYREPEIILTIILKTDDINWDIITKQLNSYQKRYLGAILELSAKKFPSLVSDLKEDTINDNRIFSIRKGKHIVPEEYKKISEKWRINLNVNKVVII